METIPKALTMILMKMRLFSSHFLFSFLYWKKRWLMFVSIQVVETCPTGCEQDLYQNVCKLRERRIIEDALLQESSKQHDGLSTLSLFICSFIFNSAYISFYNIIAIILINQLASVHSTVITSRSPPERERRYSKETKSYGNGITNYWERDERVSEGKTKWFEWNWNCFNTLHAPGDLPLVL